MLDGEDRDPTLFLVASACNGQRPLLCLVKYAVFQTVAPLLSLPAWSTPALPQTIF